MALPHCHVAVHLMLDELVAGKISISLVGAGPAELLLMKSVSGVEKSRADIVANCKLFKT